MAYWTAIGRKTLPDLNLCMLLAPDKVVSSKGRLRRLSSECRKKVNLGILWSCCALRHQCQRNSFITVTSGIWMTDLCAVTSSETKHKSTSTTRQIQWKALFSSFSLKDLGSFGGFLGFAFFKHKGKPASLRSACFPDSEKRLNSDNFKYPTCNFSPQRNKNTLKRKQLFRTSDHLHLRRYYSLLI